MKLSFIVSAFNRPLHLRLCLSALIIQTFADFEIIVMDNAVDSDIRAQNRALCEMDERIRYFPSYNGDQSRISCYFSGDYAALKLAQGEWLSFPSEDSWYAPWYAEKLLRLAGEQNLELVYSNLLMTGPNGTGVLNCEARVCMIDKTNFLVKRDRFIPFPNKQPDGSGSCSDGDLIDDLVRQGIRHGKYPEVLAAHM